MNGTYLVILKYIFLVCNFDKSFLVRNAVIALKVERALRVLLTSVETEFYLLTDGGLVQQNQLYLKKCC